MKKIAFALLSISLLLIANIAVAENTNTNNNETDNEKIEQMGEDFGIETWGPLNNLIVKITITGGDEEDILKVNNLLNNKTQHYILPIQIVEISNLTFKVQYKIDITLKRLQYRHPYRFFKQYRFFYKTEIFGAGGFSKINQKHDVTVKEFSGQFIILRGKPFKMTPPRFVFDGSAKTIIMGS